MRITPRLLTPATDWIVFIVVISISLTTLFVGKSPAVGVIKNEIGDLFSFLAVPTIVVRQSVDLWKENERLRNLAMNLSKENDDLREAAFENERLRAMLDFQKRFSLPMKAAEVVAYPGAQIGGLVRINAGLSDGAQINSVVLTPMGLVGKITEAGRQSSLVQTLMGNTYGVSVIVERSREMGIMRWQSGNEWKIIGLPTGADVKVGDLVMTTGQGAVFPKGIRVGVVSTTRVGNNSLGKDYIVRPFVDMQSLEEVFFVTHTDQVPVEPEVIKPETSGQPNRKGKR
jgi:rod shape-determining protein MreC